VQPVASTSGLLTPPAVFGIFAQVAFPLVIAVGGSLALFLRAR
jgi:hypothetical protein